MNSKLSGEIKPRKQANELPKSDKHSDKLINQLNHCKIIADLCESFDYLSYIYYHADLLKMESQKTFMGSKVKYTNIGTVRQTRLHSVDAQVSAADRIGMVKERLSTLTRRLHNDLASEVLDYGTKKVIANCRVIYDLLEKIYQKESVMVRLEETETILIAVRIITGCFATIYEGNLINHYRMFVANL